MAILLHWAGSSLLLLVLLGVWKVDGIPRSSSERRFNPNTGVKFYLFTADNGTAGEPLDIHNVEQLRRSTFNPSDATRFLIHGWYGDRTSGVNRYLRNAYHQHASAFNVIVVDWGAGAKTINYVTARNLVPVVGQFVARFIDYLHTFGGLQLNATSIIGHSLGAHVAGLAGKNILTGRLQSIVGLDPARPLFDIGKPNERLANTDASYVETLHTNRGLKGFSRPIGDAAFYPNWGSTQLGCGRDVDGSCSHTRAVLFFDESIRRPDGRWFNATRCSSYDEIKDKRCRPSGYAAMGGEPLNHSSDMDKQGVFYVQTSDRSPFGLASDVIPIPNVLY